MYRSVMYRFIINQFEIRGIDYICKIKIFHKTLNNWYKIKAILEHNYY